LSVHSQLGFTIISCKDLYNATGSYIYLLTYKYTGKNEPHRAYIIGDSRLKSNYTYSGTPITLINVRTAQKELKEKLYMMYMFGLP